MKVSFQPWKHLFQEGKKKSFIQNKGFDQEQGKVIQLLNQLNPQA